MYLISFPQSMSLTWQRPYPSSLMWPSKVQRDQKQCAMPVACCHVRIVELIDHHLSEVSKLWAT